MLRSLRVAATRWLWGGVGIALLVLPLVPPAAVGGYDAGPNWIDHLVLWGIGFMVVMAVGLLAGRLLHSVALPQVSVVHRPVAVAVMLAVVCGGVSAWFQYWPFARGTYLIDEMAQLFHARVLLNGVLAAPPPVVASAALFPHTWITDAGWISQYPPGHVLLLAVGLLARIEWMVNPALYAASALLVFILGRSLYGPSVGVGATVLWTLSSWVSLTASSYMNHTSAVAVALVAWVAVFGVRDPTRARYLIAGAALAFLASIRPLDAIAAAVPVGIWIAHERRWSSTGWFLLGATPIGVLWALFNVGTVGEPFTLGYTILYGREHGLGFHVDPWGRPYTPAVAVANAIAALRRLHVYAFEWPIPSLLLLGVWSMMGRKRSFADLITGVGIVTGPVLYLLYWHSGFFRGPRFYLLAAPFLFIAMARGWVVLRRWLAKKSPSWIRFDRGLLSASVVVVLWGGVGFLPSRLQLHADAFPVLKQRPREQLVSIGTDSAVVLVRTSWGNRVVADLWALGVKPGIVERAYRRMDTCDLDVVRRDGLRGTSAANLSRRLAAILDTVGDGVPALAGWPDPTVRLRNGRTSDPRCAEELQRDLEGFTIAEHLLSSNNPTLRTGIVFARDFWERNDELLNHYPGWDVWTYRPPVGTPSGPPRLERLRGDGE